MSKDKADNVFYEKIPQGSEIQMPDQKNFVKFVDCSHMLDEVPMLNEILRHIVPPPVRRMQAEFQQFLQNLVEGEYNNNEKVNLEQKSFYGQFNLPQAYHELTAVADIPDSIMDKIMAFQKKGAVSNFQS